MKIIIGHSNTDLDCIGSMVLARCLYPAHNLISSRSIQPAAKALFNLYRHRLNLLPAQELRGSPVESAIIVDTRSRERVREYFELIAGSVPEILIYDHHPGEGGDIPGARIRQGEAGANTTLLGLELLERGLPVHPEEATIALTGIYADTGNFTHENVRAADFQVARYLTEQGASLTLVRSFLKTFKEDYQIGLFHELVGCLTYRNIHGQLILLSHLELEKQAGGLAAVVEKVFEVENPDALFSLFSFRKEGDCLIVARSQSGGVDLNRVLAPFGGGGHTQAASALLKGRRGPEVLAELEGSLGALLEPALAAGQIMSREVITAQESWTLLETSILLEKIDHTGLPVTDERDMLVGVITLRDIMKGRKAAQMKAPVKAYMSRRLVSGTPSTTLREIEELFFRHGIGHLPIVEDGRLAGIVTRTDYLEALEKQGAGRASRSASVKQERKESP